MITLESVTKTYDGNSRNTLIGIDLDIHDGEVHILLGPSGCGKTTLLKMMNRLIEPTSGDISVDGRNIKVWNPIELRRHIGYVIQQIGLFPHFTIGDNMAIVPRLLKWPEKKVQNRIIELMQLIGLPREYLKKRPRELSGGQQQRVGVARALAADPPMLLMDEPFGAIDPITRRKLQDEFAEIQKRLGKTVVFVTHDIDEAIRLGTRISILKDGHLIQTGTPKEILAQPKDRFVSELFGDDLALKRLTVLTAGEVAFRGTQPTAVRFDTVESEQSLLSVVVKIFSENIDGVRVVDEKGEYIGYIDSSVIRSSAQSGGREGDAQ